MKNCHRYTTLHLLRRHMAICVQSLCLLMLPGVLSAAESPQMPIEPSVAEQEAMEAMRSTMSTQPPRNSHASRQADPELLRMAAQEPEKFVGKVLRYENGQVIGPVLKVRRRIQDLNHYLIVDATEYFNSETEFAVPMNDVARMNDDSITILEAQGMHLRGMEYYADDYEDAGEPIAE